MAQFATRTLTAADMGIDRLSEPRIAANLTDAQVNDLENRGFTQAQVESVKDSRKNALNEISAGTFVLPMPSNPNMTQTESDAFLADRQQFQKDRKRRLVQNSEQFSQLPASAFGKPGMFEFITPQMLDERLRTNNNFKDAERDTMVTEIQSLINDPSTPTGVVRSWQTQSDRSVNIGRLNLDFSRLQNNQTQTTPAPANTPPPPPNPAARPPLLTPNSPGWSQANQNLPPRPGPQP